MEKLISKFRAFSAKWNADMKRYDLTYRGFQFGYIDQDGQWWPQEINDIMSLDRGDIHELLQFTERIFEELCKEGHPVHD